MIAITITITTMRGEGGAEAAWALSDVEGRLLRSGGAPAATRCAARAGGRLRR
jgi:hypothetical protein